MYFFVQLSLEVLFVLYRLVPQYRNKGQGGADHKSDAGFYSFNLSYFPFFSHTLVQGVADRKHTGQEHQLHSTLKISSSNFSLLSQIFSSCRRRDIVLKSEVQLITHVMVFSHVYVRDSHSHSFLFHERDRHSSNRLLLLFFLLQSFTSLSLTLNILYIRGFSHVHRQMSRGKRNTPLCLCRCL